MRIVPHGSISYFSSVLDVLDRTGAKVESFQAFGAVCTVGRFWFRNNLLLARSAAGHDFLGICHHAR